MAAWQGSLEVVQLLLDFGASPDSTDNEGRDHRTDRDKNYLGRRRKNQSADP